MNDVETMRGDSNHRTGPGESNGMPGTMGSYEPNNPGEFQVCDHNKLSPNIYMSHV